MLACCCAWKDEAIDVFIFDFGDVSFLSWKMDDEHDECHMNPKNLIPETRLIRLAVCVHVFFVSRPCSQ